jgi:hypothetical protein
MSDKTIGAKRFEREGQCKQLIMPPTGTLVLVPLLITDEFVQYILALW